MASTRTARHALASYDWIKDERAQANEETLKHVEDFGYSVTHELEWLNEKMAEVFSGDAKTLTDIFKTPGRLRNKTPRTLRKPPAQTPRLPLGDVFAPNTNITPILSPKLKFDNVAPFEIAEDIENQDPAPKPSSRSKSPQRAGKPGNTDSGYHGMTEDEMEVYALEQPKQKPSAISGHDDTVQSGEDSFTSARERGDTVEPQPHATAIKDDVETAVLGAIDEDTVPYSPDSLHEAHKIGLNRKSSFNFSSLPAREPLLSKKSFGAHQGVTAGPRTSAKSSASQTDEQNAPQEPGKTTTQLLHERITMLGLSKNPRLSKSASQGTLYPELPTTIQPTMQPQYPDLEPESQPVNQAATSSASARPQSAIVQPTARPISMMSFSTVQESATPGGSPSSKKQYDGPLSASKNRLMSVLKSARSIFASSASASAAAKLEAHSTTPSRPSPSREVSHDSVDATVFNMPGALQSDAGLVRTLSRPISIISTSPSRKARNSDGSEKKRDKEAKAQQKAAQELEKARERERAKVAKEQEDRLKAEKAEAARREKEAQKIAKAQEKEASVKPAAPAAGKLRSIVRPARPAPAPKVMQSVNVKTTSQAQNDSATLPRPTSAPRPSSAYSQVKASTLPPSRPASRALEAAARKKELEQKDKLRREQQKKELERKRAAKQAETDRKAAEAQRIAQEAKLIADQAAEAKRQEQLRIEQEQRRLEVQRQQEEAQRQKAAQELAESIARERAQQQATGTIRQLGQKNADSRPPVNTVKPAKRPADAEEPVPQRVGPYQQNEGKRRKTDELEENTSRPSVMGPPMRPSAIRKETITRFPNGYTQAAPSQQPATLFKTVQQYAQQIQRPTHPMQTVQMSNARIAFAESSKAPVAMPSGHPEPGKFKTPVRAVQNTAAKSAAKSSPMYPNGDSIALPEINTDSEDEDDDDDEDNTGFRAPSWVMSPALRVLLTDQQLVDPESVFGPIGELKMEEVFKNNKNPERLKKFRDRGSSAAWVQNGDAVTSAEKRRDMEMRERVAREGGWRYQPGLL